MKSDTREQASERAWPRACCSALLPHVHVALDAERQRYTNPVRGPEAAPSRHRISREGDDAVTLFRACMHARREQESEVCKTCTKNVRPFPGRQTKKSERQLRFDRSSTDPLSHVIVPSVSLSPLTSCVGSSSVYLLCLCLCVPQHHESRLARRLALPVCTSRAAESMIGTISTGK